MQRFFPLIILFSFTLLSFSSACMAFSKLNNKYVINCVGENKFGEENEKELEVKDLQMFLPLVVFSNSISLLNFFSVNKLFILSKNYKLIPTPPPRD